MTVSTIALVILGVLLVGVCLVDLLTATLVLRGGGGVVSSRVLDLLWRAALRITKPESTARSYMGMTMVLTILGLWSVTLSLGWALIFHAAPDAFSHPSGPPDLGEHLYIAMSRAWGRGSGGFEVQSSWRWLEQAAGVTGVFVISLSIAYFISVVGAVARKRSTANYMRTLGETTPEVLRRAWNGSSWGNLDLHLIPLTAEILNCCQEHLAYPVVHHYRAPHRAAGFAPNLAVLVRAAHTIVERSVSPPPNATLEPFLTAVDLLLEASKCFDFDDERECPPQVYEVADEEAERLGLGEARTLDDAQLESRERRARHLRVFCEHSGWSWPVEDL